MVLQTLLWLLYFFQRSTANFKLFFSSTLARTYIIPNNVTLKSYNYNNFTKYLANETLVSVCYWSKKLSYPWRKMLWMSTIEYIRFERFGDSFRRASVLCSSIYNESYHSKIQNCCKINIFLTELYFEFLNQLLREWSEWPYRFYEGWR